MSKRHFELIAETIKELRFPVASQVNSAVVAWQFYNALAKTNPRFDKDRFLEACGLGPESSARQAVAVEKRKAAYI